VFLSSGIGIGFLFRAGTFLFGEQDALIGDSTVKFSWPVPFAAYDSNRIGMNVS
jgi:hypothetical protein